MKKTLIVIAAIIAYSTAFSQIEAQKVKNAIGEQLYKTFCGKLYVKNTEANSLLLFFEAATKEENFYSKSILIESNGGENKIAIDNNDTYDVFIPQNRRYIILNSKTKNRVLYLGLFDVENLIKSVSDKISSAKKENTFLGYGLSYMENKWNKETVQHDESLVADIVLLNSNDNIPETLKKDGQSQTNYVETLTCSSGGPGSSECSVQQGFPTTQVCSVTCNAGYFACCDTNVFKCKCIKSKAEND